MHSVIIACTITTLITTYIYIASFKVQLSQQLHCSVSYRWGYLNTHLSTYTYTLGCCECLCKKIKIGIVPSNSKIKLPFDMGFNKIEKFFKNFNVFDCHQGAKVTENKDFS